MELLGLGESRTGHTGKLIVETEEVLEGNGGESHGLLANLDTFLSFDGLVKTFVVTAAMHETTGVLIDDDNFARVGDDVIFITLEKSLSTESLLEVIDNACVVGRIKGLDTENILNFFDALVGQSNRAALFIDNVIFVGKLRANLSELIVALRIVASWRRNDERRTSFIDQDRVDLIDNREVEFALTEIFGIFDHVVTQIVEAEFVVGTIGNIAEVGLFTSTWFEMLEALIVVVFVGVIWVVAEASLVDDDTNGKTEEVIELTHPAGVALCKVIVDGHHVDTAAS